MHMPESVGDNSADIDNRFEEIVSMEMDSYFPVYKRFDKSRSELYRKLSLLSSDELDKQTAESLNIEGVSKQFGELLPHILNASDGPGNFVERVVYIVHEDSTTRTRMIDQTLGVESELVISPEKVSERFSEYILKSDTTEEILTKIVAFYDNDLKADINHLVVGIAKKHNISLDDSDDDVSTIEIKKQTKDHVVDVVKIVAGVAIALAADRFLRRRS